MHWTLPTLAIDQGALTATLAALQTIAGAGSIIAAIVLGFQQRRWAREDRLRSRLAEVRVAVRLLEIFERRMHEVLALGPGEFAEAIERWRAAAGETRDALVAVQAMLSHPAALLAITRCIRKLLRAAQAGQTGDFQAFRAEVQATWTAMLGDRDALSILERSLVTDPLIRPRRSAGRPLQ
jgi:hypothetical protein